jgi:hypothetical protein
MKPAPDIESRLVAIEGLLREVLGILAADQPPDKYSYQKAIQQFAAGDRGPLTQFLRKGGKSGGGGSW